MADNLTTTAQETGATDFPAMPRTLDEARAMARQRFKERLDQGEKIGQCECGEESAVQNVASGSAHRVAGVRFLDSGRTYYFEPGRHSLEVGDWVVVETSRGKEAGRVIIAPHQVRESMLEGELKPVLRKLNSDDLDKMNRLKKETAGAVRTFSAKIREHGLPMKPISAEYNFDGSHLLFNFSAADRVDFRDLAKELAGVFHCRVELRQVGPRDEARLLGGVGRCGRTLCCSSWLPVYPEISMNMAKTQDLPLNPSKVSGVCGRLLCCLSYENDQYKQMKAVMPRLGQPIETPEGPGMVVSMQLLKDLITVRLAATNTDQIFSGADLGLRRSEAPPAPRQAAAPAPQRQAPPPPTPALAVAPPPVVEQEAADDDGDDSEPETPGEGQRTGGRRRRRRGRGSRRRAEGQAEPQA